MSLRLGIGIIISVFCFNFSLWGCSGESNTLDTTSPTVSSTTPANNTTGVAINSAMSATFSEAMDSSTITADTFTLTSPAGVITGAVNYSGTTATFTPSSNLAYNTVYTVKITTGVKDLAGNSLAVDYVWSFTTGQAPDTTAPTVSLTNPTNNATGVTINSAIGAAFSEAMDPLTITTATFTLTGPTGTVVGLVNYSDTTATFTPLANLDYDTTYTATIITGAKDLAGNALAANYTWSFTTGPAPDTTPPTVLSTIPSNGVTGIVLNTVISANFSEALDPLTITTATFTLTGPIGAVAGTVNYNGTTATFTPAANLEYNTTYTATITTGVKDLSGNVLNLEYVWRFTTQDRGKAWDTAALIENNPGSAHSPDLAVNSNGNAVAVWQQFDGVRYNVWANRYVVGTGWLEPVLIENSDQTSDSPQVAIAGNSNAMVVWIQWEGLPLINLGQKNIWASYYDVDTGWSIPILIGTNIDYFSMPHVAVDGRGNAVAVWIQGDSIWANRYETDTGWGLPTLIENHTGKADEPQIAMDGSGNAIAVWQQFDGVRYNVWANRYVVGIGWGTPTLIEMDDLGDNFAPQVGIDGTGNAIAVWSHYGDLGFAVWANRYLIGVGWGAPDNLGSGDDSITSHPPVPLGSWHPAAFRAQIAMSNSGNAMVVWNQFNIWASRYVVDAGWSIPTLIKNDDGNWTSSPKVAGDGNGNVVAIWAQWDGTYENIWANYYVAGSGWNSADVIENENWNAFSPEVAVDASGNALAVWSQFDGVLGSNIWANRLSDTVQYSTVSIP